MGDTEGEMNPLRWLARIFIDVFGITHPTPKQEQQAAWFICTLLALLVVGLGLVFLVLSRFSHH